MLSKITVGEIMEETEEIFEAGGRRLDQYPNKIFTIPNMLTFLRFLLLPVLIYSLEKIDELGYTFPVLVGSVMILSDILDGIIARRLKQYSRLGVILDPVFDKIIISTLAIYFAYKNMMPDWVAIVVVARDMAILIFGFFTVAKGYAPQPVLWGRLWALLWGVAFILLLLGYNWLAWSLIVVALILGFFSAGNYYVMYLKNMENSQ